MSFKLKLEPLTVPLREPYPGVYRVGQSRVSFEIVLEAFQNGATPEAIVQSYDTLELPDVYAVLAYYLNNKEEVEAYLRWCDEDAEAARREVEVVCPPIPNYREILMERCAKLQEERRAPAVQ